MRNEQTLQDRISDIQVTYTVRGLTLLSLVAHNHFAAVDLGAPHTRWVRAGPSGAVMVGGRRGRRRRRRRQELPRERRHDGVERAVSE